MEIGKPITDRQKDILHRVLNTQDLIDISVDAGVSYSTVRAIYYRVQSITDDNVIALQKMIARAFEKTEDAIAYFEKAKRELEGMLPKIEA